MSGERDEPTDEHTKAIAKAAEAFLHLRFSAQHVRGEWFRLEGPLAEWVTEGCYL